MQLKKSQSSGNRFIRGVKICISEKISLKFAEVFGAQHNNIEN
jgi:hypothetical protein